MKPGRVLFFEVLALCLGASFVQPMVVAGQTTATDYARAEGFLGWNTANLVTGDQVAPIWLDGDRFWYRNHVRNGHQFVLVDPSRGTRDLAFDHHRLAAALSMAADTSYEGNKLPFQEFELAE